MHAIDRLEKLLGTILGMQEHAHELLNEIEKEFVAEMFWPFTPEQERQREVMRKVERTLRLIEQTAYESQMKATRL